MSLSAVVYYRLVESSNISACVLARNHMSCSFFQTAHSFSLGRSPSGVHMDFYLKVKAVNYIRRQMHFGMCPCCTGRFDESGQLKAHMETERHCRLPDDMNKWNQSQ